MSSKKIRDLLVKVGSYTDRNTGQEKARWENVGALMVNDDNGEKSYFIMLKKTFNPAGVPSQEGRESILISAFVPQDRDNQNSSSGQQDRSGGDYSSASGGERSGNQSMSRDMDDEIPF
ncbi:hypothetical protein NN6n1_12810 [Shinella zoogloeoides]